MLVDAEKRASLNPAGFFSTIFTMSLIEHLSERLKRHPKRIVFPEGDDPRILQAARLFASRKLGVPILLGSRSIIKEHAKRLNIDLEGIRLLDPARSDELEMFCQKFQGLRRFKGLDKKETLEYLLDNNYFGAMMLATGNADALVAGATLRASSALRPLFQIVPFQAYIKTVSSMLILETADKRYGINGTLFLADCGVIPEPSEEQLADIAMTTACLTQHLTDVRPKVALLSYTTKSKRSQLPVSAKMKSATALAQQKFSELYIEADVDGEMQVDAALDPHVAQQKNIGGSVAGRANVLIFPDLSSGNNAAKMMQILGGARAYGQILTGLKKPAAEISRGASAHDIFGTAVVVAAQSVDKNFLYAIDPDEFK